MDKGVPPKDTDLKKALGVTYPYWKDIERFAIVQEPDAKYDWHFSGAKYGWSYRISDKKRVIVYLLPRDQFFKVALVFGPKAAEIVFNSNVADDIKNELRAAEPYAEGRGIRIDVRDGAVVDDIKRLVEIKVA